MTKHPIDVLSAAVSRRQVMTGAAATSRLPPCRLARCKARA
jgi:hypothetical protein